MYICRKRKMEQETWKPVVGYEGLYEVSDMGRVKSLNYRRTGKEEILKLEPDTLGYLRVGLYKNGKRERVKVHILVMRTFKGECPKGHEVDHYDWNPKNNRLENLRYLPAKQNAGRHSDVWTEKHAEAIRRTKSKPVDQYTLDGEFVNTWSSASEAARVLGYNQRNISTCCRGGRNKANGFRWRFSE